MIIKVNDNGVIKQVMIPQKVSDLTDDRGLQLSAIADAGGYFSTDTVEDALQELGAALDGVAALLAAI